LNGPIRGSCVLNPYLHVPEVTPTPKPVRGQQDAAKTGERKNLLLECTNGNITASVWVVGDHGRIAQSAGVRGAKRTTIYAKTTNGSIDIRVDADCATHPFALTANTHNGVVRVWLPRSFKGPVTSHARVGWMSTSPAVSPNMATFSDMNDVRKGFIGELADSGYGHGEWQGSSLDLTCAIGRIKVYYLDEVKEGAEAPQAKSSSFLGKIFGLRF